jgi:hypothetical protein
MTRFGVIQQKFSMAMRDIFSFVHQKGFYPQDIDGMPVLTMTAFVS